MGVDAAGGAVSGRSAAGWVLAVSGRLAAGRVLAVSGCSVAEWVLGG